MRAALCLVLLAGCAVPSGPAVPVAPAPPGTAEAACAQDLRWRSGGSARITAVRVFEDQRALVRARGPFGVDYKCFTDARGRVVNVMVDRDRGR